MDELDYHFNLARSTPSDICMHLNILKGVSGSCNSVLELGRRSCVSSWAFLMGLAANSTATKKSIVANDIEYHPNVDVIRKVAGKVGVDYKFVQKNDLELDMEDTGGIGVFDIVFIDTWHIYGQLKREMEKFHSMAGKFIIMHDTDIDAEYGESIRMGHDIEKMSAMSGMPSNEITRGLRYAIEEFLHKHTEWFVLHAIRDGIGLTILAKRDAMLSSILQNAV